MFKNVLKNVQKCAKMCKHMKCVKHEQTMFKSCVIVREDIKALQHDETSTKHRNNNLGQHFQPFLRSQRM